MAFKQYGFQTDAVNKLADAYYANKKNVVQSVSEKTVDEPTKETDETAETPKKRKRHWWQFGRKAK